MDVYLARYPPATLMGMGHALELETFEELPADGYRVDLAAVWHDHITRGEIFRHILSLC